MPNLKLGSLFDGSGGFPLAGSLCGIEPVWASEVEPYPIAVTKSRFPNMTHLGDISKINGAEIEPVDIVTFGSPCQDLSIAGGRAGLKHEANGDEETTRSGLFMEAVRIIKEMRKATNGKYPTFALWENVPGAFSSNRGEDFRTVCEELIKIVEPGATMPAVPKAGWAYADCYMGDGWSFAYRTFDAQYWGVPQRRRRIHALLDLRGERAGKILFEREGLRGYFETGRTPWKETARDAGNGSAADDCESRVIGINGEVAGTLDASYYKGCGMRQGTEREVVVQPIAVATQQGGAEISENGICPTVTASAGMSGNNQPWICQPVTYDARGDGDGEIVNAITGDHENRITDYTSVVVEPTSAYWDGTQVCGTLTANNANGAQRMPDKENFNCVIAIDRAFYNQGQNALYEPQFYEDGTVPTLVAKGPGAVCHQTKVYGMDCRNGRLNGDLCGTLQAKPNGGFSYNCIHPVIIQTPLRYIVRRLTPTECARLQGFPDTWGHPDHKEDLTVDEFAFWLDVRNTHAAINGKAVKDYTTAQTLKWYNGLHTDSAEYKMWGNGIALPPALYCMQGIIENVKE